ncbi:hypothetical protein ERX27_11270, partial [Macrococcus brunensis]
VEWQTPPDVSKPGATTGTVVVTYPDGTKDVVTVPVTVEVPAGPTDAVENTPIVTPITTPVGVVPPATEGIGNEGTFPPGTTVEWQTPPDVSKPGTTTGTVVVTYPDGTKDVVTVPV